MNKPRQAPTRFRTFGAYAREQRILRYQQGKTDPKGIWRAKKGRLSPSNPPKKLPIIAICKTLVVYVVRLVGLTGLLIASFWLYYLVATTNEFVATILWDSLIRVFVALFATPFFVFSLIGLWVYGICEPFERALHLFWQWQEHKAQSF